MYLFAQNRVQKYLGAVAMRPRAGFRRDIMGGGPNPALTWVVTAPNQPPRYVIDIGSRCRNGKSFIQFWVGCWHNLIKLKVTDWRSHNLGITWYPIWYDCIWGILANERKQEDIEYDIFRFPRKLLFVCLKSSTIFTVLVSPWTYHVIVILMQNHTLNLIGSTS